MAGELRVIQRVGKDRWCIVVSGSRRLTMDAHGAAVRAVLEEYRNADHVVVIHGAYEGLDQIAAKIARELGYEVLGIPYFDIGPAGGPARNRCLIDLGIVLFGYSYGLVLHAFPDSKSRGTYRTIEYAEARYVTYRKHVQ